MALFIENEVLINAPTSEVWDALTNPAQTKRYMFGCEALSDWKPGSPLLWQGVVEGNPVVFVKGYVISFEPENLLVYSVFDPNSAMEDIPANYLLVTYSLSKDDQSTLLKVTQGDYDTVANGEQRYQESYNDGLGWSPILDTIKKLVEEK